MSELPPLFMPLFVAAFVVNAAYIGCFFALSQRLRATAVKASGYEAPSALDNSPVALFKFLGFVFSDGHAAMNDPVISRLTWSVRILFVAGLVLTLSVFGLALGLV